MSEDKKQEVWKYEIFIQLAHAGVWVTAIGAFATIGIKQILKEPFEFGLALASLIMMAGLIFTIAVVASAFIELLADDSRP